MPFTEAVKLEAKRNAHFRCCLCRELGSEVHHIIPEADGGPDEIDNAAYLCATCHDIFGGNPTKRKLIRQARDQWYEICEAKYGPVDDRLSDMETKLRSVTSRVQDLSTQVGNLEHLLRIRPEQQGPAGTREGQKSAAVTSFREAVSYIILGAGDLSETPIADMAVLLGAEVLDAPPWSIESQEPVKQVAFRSPEQAKLALENIVTAYQKASQSGGDLGQSFLIALKAQLLSQAIAYAVEKARTGQGLEDSDRVISTYMIFGVLEPYAPYFEAANALEQVRGGFEISPDSQALLFRDVRLMEGWADALGTLAVEVRRGMEHG